MADGKNITLEQLVEFAGRADTRLDALEAGTPREMDLTLTAGGWTGDSGDSAYPFRYRLTVAGVTADSITYTRFDAGSRAAAIGFGLCNESNLDDDTITYMSITAPTCDLTGKLYVIRRPFVGGGQKEE